MGDLKDILINVGAIAGFAGIVGLAVLAMLYFSQARDVRRLREWAGREPERAGEVELRAQQIASQAIAQAYESMALRQSEADAAAGIAQEQGVEVAEPLVAEGFVEGAVQEGAEVQEGVLLEGAEQEGAVQKGAEEAVLAEAGAEAADQNSTQQPATKEHCVVGDLAAEEAAEAESGEGSEAEAPAEAAAASANGSGSDTVVHPPPVPGQAVGAQGEERPSRLAPSTPAAARAGVPLPPLPPLDTSEFHSVNRPTTPPIPDYYLSSESIGTGTGTFESIVLEDEPKRSRVPFAVAGVLVAVFAVILIATQIGGSSNEPPQNGASAQRDARDRRATSTSPRNPEINRPAVTISVLNGTDTAGLANLVSDKLTQAGFTDNTPGNRNDGTNHASSTVYYASGSKLEAQEVARELKIKDVKEADEQTLAAGGSVPVIVVLGADLAQ